MKLEPRGKYPGVKVHLDEEECQSLMVTPPTVGGHPIPGDTHEHPFFLFGQRLSRKIHALLKEHPNLLDERTPEQIKAELETEFKKAQQKLSKMQAGKEWNAKTDQVPMARCASCGSVYVLESLVPITEAALVAAGIVAFCSSDECGGVCRKED